MASMPSRKPSEACHTCRRRRLKCDTARPVCQKCISAGIECLGYGKLFLWNQGVASRGKMMGKTYQAEAKVNVSLPIRSSTSNQPRKDQTHASSGKEHSGMALHFKSNSIMPAWVPGVESATMKGTEHEEDWKPALQWCMTDPIFKDLSPSVRYYIFHFATQLCSDYVVYDIAGENPIRNLIPAIPGSPLLLQVIVANAAHHIHNITSVPFDRSFQGDSWRPCQIAYYQAVSRFGGPLQSSYRDALVAKSTALALLTDSVTNITAGNVDLILASVLMLINYDLIESGKDSWKVHVEGARKIIDFLDSLEGQNSTHSDLNNLRKHLISDVLIFCILGSTLTNGIGPKISLPRSIELDDILRHAETNNYLSCPAPLLRIMLQSYELLESVKDPKAAQAEATEHLDERVKSLIHAAQLFNPADWAQHFRPALPSEDFQQRIRIASAHRCAVCLYIARVLPDSSPLLDLMSTLNLINIPMLVDEIIHHLSFLHPGDAVFKSICWPLFLAGAETEIPEQRIWIMNRLDALWDSLQWGYIRTAQEVLNIIWKCKDGSVNKCWVDEVRRAGAEFLIA